MLWSLADPPRPDGLLVLEYPYFECDEPLVWDEGGTYVATDHVLTNTVTHDWSHGLAEIVTAVMDAGMELTMLEEHDSVPSRRCQVRCRNSRAANGVSLTGRSACRTPTRCRRAGRKPKLTRETSDPTVVNRHRENLLCKRDE